MLLGEPDLEPLEVNIIVGLLCRTRAWLGALTLGIRVGFISGRYYRN